MSDKSLTEKLYIATGLPTKYLLMLTPDTVYTHGVLRFNRKYIGKLKYRKRYSRRTEFLRKKGKLK